MIYFCALIFTTKRLQINKQLIKKKKVDIKRLLLFYLFLFVSVLNAFE